MKYDPQSKYAGVKTYQSRRVVRAGKVKCIYSATCIGLDPEGTSVVYDPNGKPAPAVGWYILFYEDGYISFCPPDQFERGYVPVEDKSE